MKNAARARIFDIDDFFEDLSMCVQACVHACMRTCVHADKHGRYAYLHMYMQAPYTHMHVRASKDTLHIHVYTHMLILYTCDTCVHMCTHVYVNIHAYVCAPPTALTV